MVVTPTCADVRAVVAMVGEAKAEGAARAAGASVAQAMPAFMVAMLAFLLLTGGPSGPDRGRHGCKPRRK